MSSFHLSCGLLVIFVNCVICSFTAKGPRCFNCEDRIDTTSCSNFTICGSHEKCYTEKYVNSMGSLMVRQGCRAGYICRTKKRENGIVTCSECCDGNYCNSQGCGFSGFTKNSYTLGPLCLSCHGSHTTQCFLHIERCSANERCLYNSPNSIVGCGGHQACLHNQCCTGDFCNDKYVFNSAPVNKNYQTTRTTQTTPKSTYISHWVSADGRTDSVIATTKSITTQSPITMVTSLVNPNTGLGPTCFSCQNVPHPSSCYNLTRCGQHEQCAVKQRLNTMGSVYYWVGCVDQRMCINIQGKRSFELCDHCCQGDHCNYYGCGETGYNHNSVDLGPICFSCDAIENPSKCTKIKRCPANEVCYIEKKSNNFNVALYTGGCKHKNDCHNAGTCCSKDLCNDNIHPAPYSSIASITTPAVPNTSKLVTANQTSLQCLLCVTSPEIATITCRHIFKTCTVNEACYRDTTIVGSRKIYTYGCTDKTLCKQTNDQTANAIFGKRSGVNKRYSSSRTCCFSDNCNAKGVNVLATTPSTLITKTSTAPSTRITTPSTPSTTAGSKPVITYITPSITLNAGSSGIFVCKAIGVPRPTIEWNGPIHHSHPSTNVNEEIIQNSIVFSKVTVDNSGYYTCIAYNTYGVAEQTVHLSVV